MEDIHKDVLQGLHQYLLEQLEIKDVCDLLISKRILKNEDVERIDFDPTRKDKCRTLLKLLPFKGKNAYKAFKESLQELQKEWIVGELTQEEINVTAKRLLDKKFTATSENEETVTSKFLSEFLLESGITLSVERTERVARQCFQCNESGCFFAKLNIFESYSETAHKFKEESKYGSICTRGEVESWTSEQVCSWLKSIQNSPLSEAVIDNFREQEITGSTLSEITEDDLKGDEFPDVKKLGHRKFIMKQIKLLLTDTTTLPQQSEPNLDIEEEQTETMDNKTASHPLNGELKEDQNVKLVRNPRKEEKRLNVRKFDSGMPGPMDKYEKGQKLNCDVLVKDDLINPVHMFVGLDLKEAASSYMMARKVVEFTCACLNARTNGRLYFGINDQRGNNFGRVEGTYLDKTEEEYISMIRKVLANCFCKDQVDIVHNCVRPLRFIEVLDQCQNNNDALQDMRFVIELDVEPMYSICKDEAFFVHLPIQDSNSEHERIRLEKLSLLHFGTEGIEEIDNDGIRSFMKKKHDLSEFRLYRENKHLRQKEEESRRNDLAENFKNMFCLGADKLGDVYPILVCNQPLQQLPDSTIKESFQFVERIPWIAVFDTDPDAKLYKVLGQDGEMNVKLIASSDEFLPNNRASDTKPEGMKSLQEDIKASKNPSWVFINGFTDVNDTDNQAMSHTDWKRNKRQGLREAIRFLDDNLPNHRSVVMFLMLSQVTDIYLETVEEFITTYPYQWMIVAENEKISNPLIDELLRRGSVVRSDIQSRLIVGMPWKHMSENVDEIVCDTKVGVCKIPSSTGSYLSIKQAHLETNFSDLEIVSATVCEGEAATLPKETLKGIDIEEENRFYKGGEVSWWNFYLQNHVLQREKYTQLQQKIEQALKGKSSDMFEESSVSRVYLYHQPGAGGTTTAKHILWSLHKIYRCVIIRSMPTERTADQLIAFRSYHDESPMPVLLLLDNLDENAHDLLLELDAKSKQSIRKTGDHSKNPFFVALICYRRTTLPTYKPRIPSTLLEHQLNPAEIRWFEKKAEKINRRNDDLEGSPHRIDSKLLISFNIMKSNFNKEFITTMTTELVKGIDDSRERELLKYVAFLNAFDISFSEVPSSAFDIMMLDTLWKKKGPQREQVWYKTWETKLSNEFRLLMNESPGKGLKHIYSFRITNVLLAREIVSVLMKIDSQNGQISTMALDFFRKGEVFKQRSLARDRLLKIIQKIMTMRGRLPTGEPETKYSPLIQKIADDETTERAIAVLEKALEITNDPFIAQHAARINMFSQNWIKALEYAKKAIMIKDDHSYLWDTYARVYSGQVEEEYQKLLQSPGTILGIKEVLNILQNAKHGTDNYQKVQQLSEVEQFGQFSNNAGYFGELQTIVALLHCLANSECFDGPEDLKKCLLDNDYYPNKLCLVLKEDGPYTEYICYLKQLKSCSERIVLKLDDERLQMKDECVDEYRLNEARGRHKKLDTIKLSLDTYFAEQTNEVPSEIPEAAKSAIRRRIVNRISGLSSRGVFDLRKEVTGMKDLRKIKKLCEDNIQSGCAEAIDYQKLIAANLSLIQIGLEDAVALGIRFDDMVSLSRKLYELRNTMKAGSICLEPYMFYVMFNWPRANTKTKFHISPNVLKDAMLQWRMAFLQKYPKQHEDRRIFKKKETTVFFFQYGTDINSLAFSEDLDGPNYTNPVRGDGFWRAAHVIRTLQRFEGVLKDASVVQIKVGDEYKTAVEILTSMPIRNRDMWYKKVYFVIGFTWSGPRAFDVSLDDPRDDPENRHLRVDNTANPEYAQKNMSVRSGKRDLHSRLMQITMNLQNIFQLKRKLERGKPLSSTEEKIISKEKELNNERNELLLQKLQQDRIFADARMKNMKSTVYKLRLQPQTEMLSNSLMWHKR